MTVVKILIHVLPLHLVISIPNTLSRLQGRVTISRFTKQKKDPQEGSDIGRSKSVAPACGFGYFLT